MPPPSPTTLPQSFISKKRRILEALAVPADQYDDLSPKGSVDEGIRDLIDEINALPGCVTTSSCAGRISVFLEGKKGNPSNESIGDEDKIESEGGERTDTKAGIGGKGGGGHWLFVSHDPVNLADSRGSWVSMLGMKIAGPRASDPEYLGTSPDIRFIHFKFEPMILHVFTASLEQAQTVLSAALQAGFRESGALNLVSSGSEPATPMVGIRSMGLALESIVGFEYEGKPICMLPGYQIRNLLQVGNERFKENTKRIERFRTLLKKLSQEGGDVGAKRKGADGGGWEDTEARRARKRAEGLEKAQKVWAMKEVGVQDLVDNGVEGMPDIGFLEEENT